MHEVRPEQRAAGRVRVEPGIYRQPNGKYAVCFMLDGRPRFRTVGYDLPFAREQRQAFMRAAQWGVLASAPRLRFAMVAAWWVERYQRKVDTGERRERTLEIHRYYLDRYLLPMLGSRLIREIAADDVVACLEQMRAEGRAEKTVAGALATLNNVIRFAVRNSWIAENPIEKLETYERPRPQRHPQRALGLEEIARLLECCLPQHRTLIATAIFTGMRLSELLGLIWQDVDLHGGAINVCAQLSRAREGAPARRVVPKTRNALREIPLAPQLVALLAEHRRESEFACDRDWVFCTRNGTPLGQRNVQRSALGHAARAAGLLDDGARLRFHDLRHTHASHLIIDLRLDVVQVSRILGHGSTSTTLDIYTHMFDKARHASQIREQMARSAYAGLLDPADDDYVIRLPSAARSSPAHGPRSARERAALRWGLDQDLTQARAE